jgi:hypothetical protein
MISVNVVPHAGGDRIKDEEAGRHKVGTGAEKSAMWKMAIGEKCANR